MSRGAVAAAVAIGALFGALISISAVVATVVLIVTGAGWWWITCFGILAAVAVLIWFDVFGDILDHLIKVTRRGS